MVLSTEQVVMHVGDLQLGVWRDPAFWGTAVHFLITPALSKQLCVFGMTLPGVSCSSRAG